MKADDGLAGLQADFADALLGSGAARFARHLAGDPVAGLRRLGVYRDAILASRREALRAAFPVVARLVADGFFDEAALRYGMASPPQCADLNRYGAYFPGFLAGYPHAAPLAWLADVARLEWAWQEAMMAADAPELDFRALAAVPEGEQPGLRLRLHPSVRLVRSAWPVLAIWEANQPDRDATVRCEEGADDVLVWRESQRVRLALLAPQEAEFVEAIARGACLEEAAGPDEAWDPAAMLRRLAEHGMLCGFTAAATTRSRPQGAGGPSG